MMRNAVLLAAALMMGASSLAMAQTGFNSSTALPPSATSPAIPNAIMPTAAPPIGTSPALGSDTATGSDNEGIAIGPPRSILTPWPGDTVSSVTPSLSMMDSAQVRDRLRTLGYSNVSNLQPKAGGGWTAVATRGRSQVSVDMDQLGNVEPR